MLDWTMSCLRIGLSKSGVSVLRVSRWRRPRVAVLTQAEFVGVVDSGPQLKHALHTVLAGIDMRSRWANVVLADEWAHYFSVASPVNVTRLADCKAVAALRFQRLYDRDPAAWQIEATWRAAGSFLACALPRWLIETLTDCSKQHGFHVTGIAPQFIRAWNQWHARIAPDSWFGVAHQDRITFSALQASRPVDADTIFVPQHEVKDSSWLQQQLRRHALMQARAVPTRFYLCAPPAPSWPTASAQGFQVIPLQMPELQRVSSSDRVLLAMQGYR